MVTFLSASDVARIVARVGARRFWTRMVETLREDFARWDAFEKSPRYASHSADGVIELMPAAEAQAFAFKCVNGHPGNTRLGLQTVVAFGALLDVATGYPALLADMTLATALRTAGASALAARYLARRDSRTMGLIGLGAQSEFQVCAFHEIIGVQRLRIFDVDPLATQKFLRNIAPLGLEIIRCADAREAARGAEIVTTVTADKKHATILDADMIAAGVHINGVGGDCPGKTELSRALLMRGDIFVEYAPQTRVEGDIQQLRSNHPVTELQEVIRGRKPGRKRDDAITIFDSVGFAVEDFSVLRLLRDLSRETGIGARLELVADLDDPKDLFSLLTHAEAEMEMDRRAPATIPS